MNIKATYTTASNYSVKIEGDVNYNLVTPEHKLWKELGIDELKEKGEIRQHDWNYVEPIPPTFEELQQEKCAEVKAWRDSEETKPNQLVIVEGMEWDAGPDSRERIESTLQSSFLPPFWTDANDVDQPITSEQLQAVHTAIVQLGFAIHARQREMKAEIKELTTITAVNNYLIGWPV